MKTFILGYATDETEVTSDGKNLTEYTTKEDADYNSCEWLLITAENIDAARKDFERQWLIFKTRKSPV